MTKNKESTRYYSYLQEKRVCKTMIATQQPNSGAGMFRKGDCVNSKASMLIECKTPTTEKESFSIKKDWIIKNKDEAFSQRLYNSAIAFTFAPNTENYFVINEKLFKFLLEKLEEDE